MRETAIDSKRGQIATEARTRTREQHEWRCLSESASLRKNVRIVSSKQVSPPGDEEEGETLHNLRIEVGRNSQPCVNREMHSPQAATDPQSLKRHKTQVHSEPNCITPGTRSLCPAQTTF